MIHDLISRCYNLMEAVRAPLTDALSLNAGMLSAVYLIPDWLKTQDFCSHGASFGDQAKGYQSGWI